MRTKITMLAVAALAAASAALAMNGCGSSCGPSNCATGCCDANNQCQLPATDHCGKNGAACSTCTLGQACLLGSCLFTGGSGNGNGATGATSTTTGSTTTGTTSSNASTTTGSTTSGSTTGSTTTGSTTTGTTNTTTNGTTSAATTGSTTGTTSATTGTTTSSTTGSTTGGSFCSGPPTDSRPPINNAGIGDSCVPNDLNFPDGGSQPQQGSCVAGEVCFRAYGPNGPPVCTAGCNATTACPGNSPSSAGAYCYPSNGICYAIGHSDNVGCPSGLLGQNAEHPSDVVVCIPPCASSADCSTGSGSTAQCSGGKCHCGSDADCNAAGGSTYMCDLQTGACYQPCLSSSTCQTGGCCLQYGNKAFCDYSTR